MTSSITTHTTHDDFSSEKACSINGEDSLYSSVMSKKSSTDFLSREFSSSSKLADSADEDESASGLFHNIKHVEQHELPLGWIRCCDENGGIYYWHKPTGTVTRRPPTSSLLNQSTTPTLVQPSTPLIPEKNFDINEFKQLNSILTTVKPVSPVTGASNINNKLSLTSSSASSTSSGSANQLPGSGMHSDFESNYTEDYDEEINQLKIEINNKTNQLVHTGSSSCSALDVDTSKSSTSADTANTKQSQINKRFYVRSLGWVKIDENDLTPERSSKAVNRCINDLSRGFRDINDVVARWGEVNLFFFKV
jgi:amyloid beta (A4) precursor protein-binding family B protein 2 (Fe65-like)